MSETVRTRFEPEPDVVTEPFWAGTRRKALLLPWCDDCGQPHWYPRRRCPRCRSAAVEWREATGGGTVAAVSRQHRPGWPGLADRVPYDVALVELDEGVRLLATLLVDPAGAPPTVGDRVTVAWEALSDGRQLACFVGADPTQASGTQSSRV